MIPVELTVEGSGPARTYHIDIVRGRNGPARSFREFFLFKAFFPQLIAGPIVRPNQTLPQIQRIFDDKWRRHRLLVFGLSLIVLGLVKKVVLADSLAPVVDDIFYVQPDSAYLAWLGAVLFLFQIYFDFSGYSDIAIGSAYLLGIRLPRNFAAPFLAASIQQLWQRWHITLTLFLRDYLFLPLADMRVVTRRYRVIQHFCAIVLTMTFVACGTGRAGISSCGAPYRVLRWCLRHCGRDTFRHRRPRWVGPLRSRFSL